MLPKLQDGYMRPEAWVGCIEICLTRGVKHQGARDQTRKLNCWAALQLSSCKPDYVGVVEVERRRPLEVMAAILEERAPERLEQFFRAHGAAEAAAMAWALASAPPPGTSPVRAQDVPEGQALESCQ